MERVTITLPPALLQKIDQERERADEKRSAYIVHTLEKYFRDREERDRTKEDLLEAFRSDEGKAILRELVREARLGPGRPPGSGSASPVSLPGPEGAGASHRRARGDSIAITEDMRALMETFMQNPDHPTRREVRGKFGVDTSDLRLWVSGEKPRMRKDTWERLKPVLEEYAGPGRGEEVV